MKELINKINSTDFIILLVVGIVYLIARRYFRSEKRTGKKREAYFSELDKTSSLTFTESTTLEKISIIENKRKIPITDYFQLIYGPIGLAVIIYFTNFHYLSFLLGIPLTCIWIAYVGMEDYSYDRIELKLDELILTKQFWFIKRTKKIKWKKIKLIQVIMEDIRSNNVYQHTHFKLRIIKKGLDMTHELKISKEKMKQLAHSLAAYTQVNISK